MTERKKGRSLGIGCSAAVEEELVSGEWVLAMVVAEEEGAPDVTVVMVAMVAVCGRGRHDGVDDIVTLWVANGGGRGHGLRGGMTSMWVDGEEQEEASGAAPSHSCALLLDEEEEGTTRRSLGCLVSQLGTGT